LPGTGTVPGCFWAIRVPAWVRLPARTVATTSIGSELTRCEPLRTRLPRPILARTGLPWSERPRS